MSDLITPAEKQRALALLNEIMAGIRDTNDIPPYQNYDGSHLDLSYLSAENLQGITAHEELRTCRWNWNSEGIKKLIALVKTVRRKSKTELDLPDSRGRGATVMYSRTWIEDEKTIALNGYFPGERSVHTLNMQGSQLTRYDKKSKRTVRIIPMDKLCLLIMMREEWLQMVLDDKWDLLCRTIRACDIDVPDPKKFKCLNGRDYTYDPVSGGGVREVVIDDDDIEEEDDEEYLAGGGVDDPEIYEDDHDGHAPADESESESIESDDYDENVDYAELVNSLENDRDRLRQHNTDQMVGMLGNYDEVIVEREQTRQGEDEHRNILQAEILRRMGKDEADAQKRVDKAKAKQAKKEQRLLENGTTSIDSAATRDRPSKNQSRATDTGTKTPSKTLAATSTRAQNTRGSKIVPPKVARAATKKKETTEQTPKKPAARIGSLLDEKTPKVRNTQKAAPKTAPSKATTKRALKLAPQSATKAGTKSGRDRSNAGRSEAIFDDDASFGGSVSTLGSKGSARSTGTRSSRRLRGRPGRPKNDDDSYELSV